MFLSLLQKMSFPRSRMANDMTQLARLRRFITQEDGPTAVEYAVLLSLIVVVCAGAIGTLGQNAGSTFGTVATATAGGGGDGPAIGSTLGGGSSVSGGIWTASVENGSNGTQTDTYNANTGEWSYSYPNGNSGTFNVDKNQLPVSQMGIGSSNTWTRTK